MSEDDVKVTVEGSCVLSIGYKTHLVALDIVFVFGILESISARVAAGVGKTGVKCSLHIVDEATADRVDIVVLQKGPVQFTTTLTYAVAVHSAERCVSATWT